MTKKQKQEYQARVNKATRELATVGGYIEHAVKLISLQYLVGSVVAMLQADIEDTFERCNMKSNKVISIQNGLNNTMDEYFKLFKGAMSQQATLDWSNDLAKLKAEVEKWAKIEELEPDFEAMKTFKPSIEEEYGVELMEAK